MSNTQKWTEDRVATLVGLVGTNTNVEVSNDLQAAASEQLGVSIRSIAAKLRNLGYSPVSIAAKKVVAYTEAEEEELRAFVESNAGAFTYAEIAEQVLNGSRNAKQIQGKLLSMELFDKVKPTPKVEVAKQYSEEEEAKIIEMMRAGAFLEDIAEAMGRQLNSIRGKALSLSRADSTLSVPKQKESHAVENVDVLAALGDLSGLTVAEIAEKTEKSERGIKTMLTRRGLTAKDYDGAKKKAKLAEAKE